MALQIAIAIPNKNNNSILILKANIILYKGDHNINTKGEKGKRNNKKTLIYFFYSNKSGHIKADCFSFKKLQQKNTSVEQSKSSATVKVGTSNHITFKIYEKTQISIM